MLYLCIYIQFSPPKISAVKKTRLKMTRDFECEFEDTMLYRYQRLVNPHVKTIQEVVDDYLKLNKDVVRRMFVSKLDVAGIQMTMDEQLNHSSYANITFSQKHFHDVTIPKYSLKQWPQPAIIKLRSTTTEYCKQLFDL